MEKYPHFTRRILAVIALLALLMGCMGATMYNLQVVRGDEFYQQSQFKIAETQTVEADRGDVLDRNGRVLVSNETVYQVSLDTSVMEDDRNEILLSLIRIAREHEEQWADTLSISPQPPFVFTREDPYYADYENEDGTTNRVLTRLGKLAVAMKWIDDPTAQPEEDSAILPVEPEEPGFFDKLKAFFTGGEEDAPADDKKEKEPLGLPEADILLERMCASFELDPSAMSAEDMRAVVGVLYELYLRSKEIFWTPYIFAEDVDIDFITYVKERDLPGVEIEATTRRAYHTEYAAHLLGRVGLMDAKEWDYYKTLDEDGDEKPDYEMDDQVGKDGVEQAFESYLRGTPGVRTVERNTEGKIVSTTWLTEPNPGDNVVLTLDIDLQKKVEDTMAAVIPNLPSGEAEGGAAVVLDVNTAELLACASYPTYSLTDFQEDYDDISTDPLSPMLNRALNGLYPPGSTFKMVTGIAGLEEGIVEPDTIINTTGTYMYYAPSYTPKCWIKRQYGTSHGKQNVSQAIMNSCNYYFFDVGRLLGIDRIGDYAARFGLAQKTGLELPEKTGIMAGPEYTESLGGTWYDGSTLSVAIGQESSQFTPIQLANYIATLVNGGTRNATHLLKEVKSSDYSSILETYEPEVLSTIEIEDENMEAVKAGMLMLTTEGSVRKYFQGLDFQVGAKTGSAQVSANTQSHAVFVCFAPYENPEVAMAIVVEHGGSGGELAAIASDVLSHYFSARETQEVIPEENTLIR